MHLIFYLDSGVLIAKSIPWNGFLPSFTTPEILELTKALKPKIKWNFITVATNYFPSNSLSLLVLVFKNLKCHFFEHFQQKF
jgi:hypothetical protein